MADLESKIYFQTSGSYLRERYDKLLNNRSQPERVQVNPSVIRKTGGETNDTSRSDYSDFSFRRVPGKNLKKKKSETSSLKIPLQEKRKSVTITVPKRKKRKEEKEPEVEWVRPNPLPTSPPSFKLAHQIRLAVHLGGDIVDPDLNPQLRNILREIWELGMPQEEVARILKQCKLGANKLNSYKLQIRFRRNIYLICCVQVGQLLSAKKKLTPILKEFNASFHYAMDLFKNVGLVEAFIKPLAPFEFDEFDSIVRTDAHDCRARALEVIDYSTGSVCFSCNPLYLSNVVKGLKAKGYEIVYTENGYRANLLVDVNWIERSAYSKFIEKLYDLNEITHVYDNVRSIDVPFEPMFNIEIQQ